MASVVCVERRYQVHKLSVIMPNVIKLNVVMLNVTALNGKTIELSIFPKTYFLRH
jgi:hypothetical protein